METIQSVLMKRDGLSYQLADIRVMEAVDLLEDYLGEGDADAVNSICEDMFGLEPDYLDQLLYM